MAETVDLEALERELLRTIDDLNRSPDHRSEAERAALFDRITELEWAIARAPATTARDVAVKARALRRSAVEGRAEWDALTIDSLERMAAAGDTLRRRHPPMSAWTRSQLERKAAVGRGETVLANQTAGPDGRPVDGALIAWAQARGLFVLIDRRSRWGNPYLLGGAGSRDQVCDRYAEYFAGRSDLHARLPELRGKVLGCWCYPERCHGETLLAVLERLAAAGG